jgi:hypothetical protein
MPCPIHYQRQVYPRLFVWSLSYRRLHPHSCPRRLFALLVLQPYLPPSLCLLLLPHSALLIKCSCRPTPQLSTSKISHQMEPLKTVATAFARRRCISVNDPIARLDPSASNCPPRVTLWFTTF